MLTRLLSEETISDASDGYPRIYCSQFARDGDIWLEQGQRTRVLLTSAMARDLHQWLGQILYGDEQDDG